MNAGGLAVGPVPSRRLSRSLGINTVPAKPCSYSCIYCQLGRTPDRIAERRPFYRPEEVVSGVQLKLDAALRRGDSVDHLTSVPDGEPTLDLHLAQEIRALRALGIPIAVMSNASLVHRGDLREDPSAADWVSLKVDTVNGPVWRRVNRPHRSLSLPAIQDGILRFSRAFAGTLVTETMLVSGANDHLDELRRVADLLGEVGPRGAYLAVPARPPAEPGVRPPPKARLVEAHTVFSERLPPVELLIGDEGDAFAASGDAAKDLRSIMAVHPMREGAVRDLLKRDGAGWEVVEERIRAGQLVELPYEGHPFYLRALPARFPGSEALAVGSEGRVAEAREGRP
ncbi:radical SAM protein [Candidatus Bipolaricaulota bacterium]|nr:radical SAM protein [Candidatus Bipolaricaulota bacterium]